MPQPLARCPLRVEELGLVDVSERTSQRSCETKTDRKQPQPDHRHLNRGQASLPEEKITEASLARRPYQQIHLRVWRCVQSLGYQILRHILAFQQALFHACTDMLYGLCDIVSSRVCKADIQCRSFVLRCTSQTYTNESGGRMPRTHAFPRKRPPTRTHVGCGVTSGCKTGGVRQTDTKAQGRAPAQAVIVPVIFDAREAARTTPSGSNAMFPKT